MTVYNTILSRSTPRLNTSSTKGTDSPLLFITIFEMLSSLKSPMVCGHPKTMALVFLSLRESLLSLDHSYTLYADSDKSWIPFYIWSDGPVHIFVDHLHIATVKYVRHSNAPQNHSCIFKIGVGPILSPEERLY